MQKKINIYIPKLLSLHNPIASCNAMPSLTALLSQTKSVQQADETVITYLNHLPIAKMLAQAYLPTLKNMNHFIAQPVHIDLDQTQGYIRLLDDKKLTESIFEKATKKLQAWAKHDEVIISPLPNYKTWILSFSQTENIEALPRPNDFLGESIYQHMPQGKLLRWFNESQMLFHMIPEAKEIGLNSLWFWGNGQDAGQKYDAFISQDKYLQLYAKFNHIACYKEFNSEILKKYNNILYINYSGRQYQDESRTYVFDDTLFKPVLAAFNKKALDEINLYFGPTFTYSINQSSRKKWWQKKLHMDEIFHDRNQT